MRYTFTCTCAYMYINLHRFICKEILKSQLATKFTIYNAYTADVFRMVFVRVYVCV